jgi:hypothetical protein
MQMFEPSEDYKRVNDLLYGGYLGIRLLFLQAFVSLTTLDLALLIALFAFAVAIPLLAASIVLNNILWVVKYSSRSRWILLIRHISPVSAIVGIVAVFWHLSWISGLLFSISGSIGYVVCTTYYAQVLRKKKEEEHEEHAARS